MNFNLVNIIHYNFKINRKVGDPNKYEQKLSKIFPKLKIKVSKKADSLYPCVSAASICAKVTRDYCITHWNCSENMTISNYGSGK